MSKRKPMGYVERGARLAIGAYIGRQIIRTWQWVWHKILVGICIWLMIVSGDAIKADQAKRQGQQTAAVSHR
jgi:hypothetical protein